LKYSQHDLQVRPTRWLLLNNIPGKEEQSSLFVLNRKSQ
jgi:hypothetical protein